MGRHSQPLLVRSALSLAAVFGPLVCGTAPALAEPATPSTRPAQGDASPLTPQTPAVKAVQNLLCRAVTDATEPGHTADVLGLLAHADAGQPTPSNGWADVDRAADRFRAAWRAKFGSSFKLSDKVPVVFTEPVVHIAGAEPATGPSTAPSTANQPASVTVVMAGTSRNAAIALHLVQGGGGDHPWRFDLPGASPAAALHDALLQHLTEVTADQSHWPTDVDQAYVYVSRHVLAALAGEPAAR